MELYIYDVVEKPERAHVLLRCLSEEGKKVLIEHYGYQRRLWFLPPEGEDADSGLWQDQLVDWLSRRFRCSSSRTVLGRGVALKRRMDANTDMLSKTEKFFEVSVAGASVGSQTLKLLPDKAERIYASCFGHTDTAVEQIVVSHGLHGWTRMPDGLRFVVENVYALTSPSFQEYRRLDAERRRPPFKVVVVYQNEILDVAEDRIVSPDEGCSLVQTLKSADPSVALVYGMTDVRLRDLYSGHHPVVNVHEMATEAKLTFAGPRDPVEGGARGVLALARKCMAVETMCEVSAITWQPWSQTCRHARKMDRVQWMLYKTFFEQGVLSPARSSALAQRQQYEGGRVLDARTGVYDQGRVALLDYTSLYPSVAIENGVCWSDDGSLLPRLWRDLIERRQQVRGVAGMQTMDYCLKLLANMTYGMFASPYFRYHSPRIASTITRRGREALGVAVGHAAASSSHRVVFGDTDSIFVHFSSGDGGDDDCQGQALAEAISSSFRFLRMKHEIDYRLLVLIGKKCYMAVDFDERVTFKGMKCVQKKYCGLGKRLTLAAAERIRKSPSGDYRQAILDTYEECRQAISAFLNGSFSIDELVIVNRLKKDPKEYRRGAGQYFADAALSCSARTFERRDYVRYYMLEGRRAVAHESLEDDDLLCIDYQWYCGQIQSMLEQLLSVLPGYEEDEFYGVFAHVPTKKRNASSSSSSSSKVGDDDKDSDENEHRISIPVFCFDCDEFTEHSGLLVLEERLRLLDRSSADCEHAQGIDDLPLPSNRCDACREPLSLKMSVTGIAKQKNLAKSASAAVNYDCNRLLSSIACAACRERLYVRLRDSGVYGLYDELMNLL